MSDSLLGRISRRLRESADRRDLARYTRGEFQSFTVDAAPRRSEASSGDSAGPMRAKRSPFPGLSERIWRSHSPGDTYAPRTAPAPPPSPPVPAATPRPVQAPPPKPAPVAAPPAPPVDEPVSAAPPPAPEPQSPAIDPRRLAQQSQRDLNGGRRPRDLDEPLPSDERRRRPPVPETPPALPAPQPSPPAPRPSAQDIAGIVANKFLDADRRETPRRGTFTADDRPPLRSPGPETEEPRWGDLPRRLASGQLKHVGSFYQIADEPVSLSDPEPEPPRALSNLDSALEGPVDEPPADEPPPPPADEPRPGGIPEASDNERGGGSHLDKTEDGWMGREIEPGSWMDRMGVSGLSPGDIDAEGAPEGIGPESIESLRRMAADLAAIRAEKRRLGGEQRGLVQAADRSRASDPTGRDADMIRRVAEARRAAKRAGSSGPMFSANDFAEFVDEPSALDPISRIEAETKRGGPFRVLPEDRSSFDHARAARKLRERIARLGPSGLLQDSAQGPGGTE